MSEKSDVASFYSGKNVFITGGTGFLGSCLIEKLIRSIPDIGKIYLLMRPKKGKSIEERLEQFQKDSVFNTLKESEKADIFKNLVPIAGEIGVDELGLSPEDRATLCDNVNIVFHSAATLDFQQNLRPTVTINLLGTRKVMELCTQMKKLIAVVHVSSAYVNSYRLNCEEILYPAPEDAEKVIGLATTLTDSALEALEPTLMGNHPNTYTFTKHLAEHEVAKCADKFSCAIVRPSMITASWKEPTPGWTTSKNGPQGFIMGASRGIVRRIPIARGLISDYIPVDVVVNSLIVAGYKAGIERGPLLIYHCTSSTCRPFTWGSVEEKINHYLHKYPLKSAVWYPELSFVSSIWMFKLSSLFVHFIPGYILDFVTKVSGGRPILIRLHTNVNASLNRLQRFIFTEWKFDNTKTMDLNRTLSETDKAKYQLDISTLQWEEYMEKLTMGVRVYLNNEPLKTLPAAKKKQNMLYGLHIGLQLFLLLTSWYLCSLGMSLSMKQCAWVAPILYFLWSAI